MGLDIYVGSLTRYYAGDWETIMQKTGREQGIEVQIVRTEQPSDAITDPNQIISAVLSWRDNLSQGLGSSIDNPLDWNESNAALYFTDKPTWDCYSSLLLWAAYAEHPRLICPHNCVEDWNADPAFQLSSNPDFRSVFSHILRNVELWLPHNFSFTFRAPDPTGCELSIGSSFTLCDQLEELNRRTWQADESTLAAWRYDCPGHMASLELGARFAFSVFLDLARKAVEHRLIMKLDY